MKKKILTFLIFIMMFLPIISVSAAKKVSCGSGQGQITGIPAKIPELTSYAIRLIQVAVPVILVIMGTIDLFKGISSSKEKKIKKGQQIFIKRLIIAVIIFFIAVIVKFIISIIAITNNANIVDCMDCFISGTCVKPNVAQKVWDKIVNVGSPIKTGNK